MSELYLNIKIIRTGQPRPYADSEYEYEIESDCGEYMVKAFCTKVLKPNSQTRDKWDTNNADSYFRGYHTFTKICENKYKYYVKQPYTG